MPHGGEKRAVQMPCSTGKKKISWFLSFWAYLHSNQSKYRKSYFSVFTLGIFCAVPATFKLLPQFWCNEIEISYEYRTRHSLKSYLFLFFKFKHFWRENDVIHLASKIVFSIWIQICCPCLINLSLNGSDSAVTWKSRDRQMSRCRLMPNPRDG